MSTFQSYRSAAQVEDEPAYRTHLAQVMDYPNSVLLNQWGVGVAKDPNVGLVVNGSFGAFKDGINATTIGGYAIFGSASGAGYGVRGYNAVGFGVGVEGESVNNVGVLGRSTNGVGVQGRGPIGVYAQSSDATSGTFALQCYNIAAVQLMAVRGDGRVMVGIGAPTARLHVDSTLAAGSTQLLRLTRSGADIFVVEDFGSALLDSAGFGSNFTIRSNNADFRLKSNGGVEPKISFLYNDGASTSGVLKGGSDSMFLEASLFGIGTAYFIPTARLHTRGSDATSGNFAFKAQDVASNDLFTVRNDGYSSFINGNLTVSTSGGYTILDATNYGSLKISLTGGGFGDYALFRVSGDILLQRPTVIGNASSPSATCTLEVGSAFGESSVGVKNVSFGNASAGHGTFSMGGQGSGGTYGPQSVRFLYDPVSFGGIATDINNNYFRVGFGVNVVLTHRVNIADGLKVVTGGVNLVGIPVGNAGLLSGDIYADTPANIALNGDLTLARKV